MTEFDLFIRNVAASPYAVFLGLVLAALPILYFISLRALSILRFLVGAARYGLKKQIRQTKIRSAMTLRKYDNKMEFNAYFISHYLRLINFSVLLVFYVSSLYLIMFSLNFPFVEKEKAVRFTREASILFGSLCAFTFGFQYLRWQAHMSLGNAFSRWALRRNLQWL